MTKQFENAIKAVRPDGEHLAGIIPSAYDISLEDMTDLFSLVLDNKPNGLYWAVVRAFEFGFVMGNRCTHSRKLKRL